jgi:hypothetical protein
MSVEQLGTCVALHLPLMLVSSRFLTFIFILPFLSSATGTYTSYTGSNCGGTATTQSQSIAGCMTDDDDSHDDAYFPGDASETMAMSCTSGAASLMNSLGAKAVLALVVGAAAFLSI